MVGVLTRLQSDPSGAALDRLALQGTLNPVRSIRGEHAHCSRDVHEAADVIRDGEDVPHPFEVIAHVALQAQTRFAEATDGRNPGHQILGGAVLLLEHPDRKRCFHLEPLADLLLLLPPGRCEALPVERCSEHTDGCQQCQRVGDRQPPADPLHVSPSRRTRRRERCGPASWRSRRRPFCGAG